jgi:hypothetical protein
MFTFWRHQQQMIQRLNESVHEQRNEQMEERADEIHWQ